MSPFLCFRGLTIKILKSTHKIYIYKLITIISFRVSYILLNDAALFIFFKAVYQNTLQCFATCFRISERKAKVRRCQVWQMIQLYDWLFGQKEVNGERGANCLTKVRRVFTNSFKSLISTHI